jgi:hypothetical protein
MSQYVDFNIVTHKGDAVLRFIESVCKAQKTKSGYDLGQLPAYAQQYLVITRSGGSPQDFLRDYERHAEAADADLQAEQNRTETRQNVTTLADQLTRVEAALAAARESKAPAKEMDMPAPDMMAAMTAMIERLDMIAEKVGYVYDMLMDDEAEVESKTAVMTVEPESAE